MLKQRFESWRIFHVARTKLPKGFVSKLYGVTTRTAEKWAANPRTCGETARNPFDRDRDLLDEINLAGYGEYARAGIDYMAEPLDGHFANTVRIRSDKGTLDGEFVDIVTALTATINEAKKDLKDGVLDAEESRRLAEHIRALQFEVSQLADLLLNYDEYKSSPDGENKDGR